MATLMEWPILMKSPNLIVLVLVHKRVCVCVCVWAVAVEMDDSQI